MNILDSRANVLKCLGLLSLSCCESEMKALKSDIYEDQTQHILPETIDLLCLCNK